MPELSPLISAEMAAEVYQVQDDLTTELFLSRPEFTVNAADKHKLVATVGWRVLKNYQDGFGLCATGGTGFENDLFLIFRGSTHANSNADWINNGRIGVEISSTGLPVHLGFNNIFSSMKDELSSFVGDHPVTGNIHCIGHSLGGAIATLAADWVRSKVGSSGKGRVKLYTFGAPRPALSLFALALRMKLGNENIHRTFHTTDPVPMIPIFPFVQPPMPGLGHCIISNDTILSASAHDMTNYIDSVDGLEWGELNKRPPEHNIESMVEEWLRSKSPVTASSHRVWQWIDSALIYVIKKIAGPTLVALQATFVGAVTIADKLAMLLKKGVDGLIAVKDAGFFVMQLITKIMQALGMAIVKTAVELTEALIRMVLLRLMAKMTEQARRAIQRISGHR